MRASIFQNGTWLSAGKMGFAAGDTNLYRYVGNSWPNATDPSGHVAVSAAGALIGAGIGAALGAVGYGISAAITGEFSWGGLAGAATSGAIAGAITGAVAASLTGDVSGLMVVGLAGGAVGGAAGSVVQQGIDKGVNNINGWEVAVSGISGALTGFVGAGLSSALARPLGLAASKVATAAGAPKVWLPPDMACGLTRGQVAK